MSDQDIIAKAKGAHNGAKFSRLWGGDIAGYPSHSEADQALCCLLCFYTRDSERIDALFRQSGLYRDKWERADYRQETIDRALEVCTETYTPSQKDKPNAHESNGAAAKKPAPGDAGQPGTTFPLGPLTLRPGRPHRTAGGKVVVPVAVLRDGAEVRRFTLSESLSNQDQLAKVLSRLLKDQGSERDAVDNLLGRILAEAAARLESGPGPEGPLLAEIVATHVVKALRLTYRGRRGLWSESWGRDVTRFDLLAYTPGPLLAAAAAAADAPRGSAGAVVEGPLFGAVEKALAVLWADLMSTLPVAVGAKLGPGSAAAREFRAAVEDLWHATTVNERVKHDDGDVMVISGSLVSRVLTLTKKCDLPRIWEHGPHGWQPIHAHLSAWWRPGPAPDGEIILRLAMHYQLARQVKIPLPEVTDQADLNQLGRAYGVLDPQPGLPDGTSGGRKRLAILDADFSRQLLDLPAAKGDDRQVPA